MLSGPAPPARGTHTGTTVTSVGDPKKPLLSLPAPCPYGLLSQGQVEESFRKYHVPLLITLSREPSSDSDPEAPAAWPPAGSELVPKTLPASCSGQRARAERTLRTRASPERPFPRASPHGASAPREPAKPRGPAPRDAHAPPDLLSSLITVIAGASSPPRLRPVLSPPFQVPPTWEMSSLRRAPSPLSFLQAAATKGTPAAETGHLGNT